MSDDWRQTLTYVENIRLLCCEFEIRTNSQDVINRLSYITQRAEQSVPVVARWTVVISWTGEELRITGDGMEDDFELSITSALETLYQRLHGRTIAALPDHERQPERRHRPKHRDLEQHHLSDGTDSDNDRFTCIRPP